MSNKKCQCGGNLIYKTEDYEWIYYECDSCGRQTRINKLEEGDL